MRRIKAVLRLVTVAAVVAVLASTIQIGGAFAATSSSPNLIVNPGAEAGAGSSNGGVVPVPSWQELTASTFTAVKYGATGGFPTKSSPGPANRGKNFFAGGPDGTESATAVQVVKLSKYVTAIQAGKATFKLQGWLGGLGSKSDSGFIEIDWKTGLRGHGTVTGSATLGPVTPAQRGDVTGLIAQATSGTVPKGTRSVLVQLSLLGSGGSYNHGFADNLSLVLTTQ